MEKDNNFNTIQDLLHQKADISAHLNLIPYDGSIEIKTNGKNKYIYMRKKVLGKYTSTYIDVYSDDLFAAISKLIKDSKEYKKQIRKINSKLGELGYVEGELSSRVLLNIDFARANIKSSIYDQAILEGIATTFPDTESILENGKVNGLKSTDVEKILNLKHAWEFILDQDVITYGTNYAVICHIASLVNEGFYKFGGKIRSVPVNIGGTTYIPPIPNEYDIKENIDKIINQNDEPINIAISLCLYCMKAQIFNDGNKRTAIIFANQYLISKGSGLMVVPESKVSEFKNLLVSYYEDKDNGEIVDFMKKYCWRNF